MHDFAERYQSFSNLALLKIVHSAGEHVPEAVAAAQQEIAQRQLSEAELQALQQEMEAEAAAAAQQKARQATRNAQVSSAAHTFFDTINPINPGIPTAEKMIRLMVIIFAGVSLYQAYANYDLIYFLIFEDAHGWSMESTLITAPIIFLPVATFLFWKRLKIGWMLLAPYLTWSTTQSILFYIMWRYRSIAYSDVFETYGSDYTFLTDLLPIVFYGGCLWSISQANIREKFAIPKSTMFILLPFTALAYGFVFWAMFT